MLALRAGKGSVDANQLPGGVRSGPLSLPPVVRVGGTAGASGGSCVVVRMGGNGAGVR